MDYLLNINESHCALIIHVIQIDLKASKQGLPIHKYGSSLCIFVDFLHEIQYFNDRLHVKS